MARPGPMRKLDFNVSPVLFTDLRYFLATLTIYQENPIKD